MVARHACDVCCRSGGRAERPCGHPGAGDARPGAGAPTLGGPIPDLSCRGSRQFLPRRPGRAIIGGRRQSGFSEPTPRKKKSRGTCMIAVDRPGIERLLTPEGRQRWDALQQVVAGYRPEPRITRDFWTTQDALGYEPYAQPIAAFIRHRDTRPPLTIGIAAAWGAGKTSVMRMVREELDPDGQRQEIRLTEATRGKLLGPRDPPGTTSTAPAVTHAKAPEVTNRRLLAEANSPIHLDDRTIKDMEVTAVPQGAHGTGPQGQEKPATPPAPARRRPAWF